MKKILSILIFVFSFFAVSLFCKVEGSSAATFYLQPASGSVQINNTISVDIRLNTVAARTAIAGIYLTYDPTKFEFVSYSNSASPLTQAIAFGAVGGVISDTQYIPAGPGDVAPVPVSGDILFGTIVFKALVGSGTTPVNFVTGAGKSVVYDWDLGKINPSPPDITMPLTGTGGTYTLTSIVIPPPAAPTIDIKANNSNGPITITYNTAATITWTSTNASSCTITANGSSFGSGLTGSKSSGNLTTNTVYAASCSGAGGTASGSVTVNVGAPPAGTKVPTLPPVTKPTPTPTTTMTPTTPAVLESKAPIITDVKVTSSSETSVTIEWTTDKLSTSAVTYGLTTRRELSSGSMDLTKNHKITLPPKNGTKLIAKNTYHFEVSSTDSSGNTARSVDQTFRTETPTDGKQLYRNAGLALIIGGFVALVLVAFFYFKNRKVVPFQPPI